MTVYTDCLLLNYISNKKLSAISFLGSDWWSVGTDLCDGLALTRHQYITWSNDDSFCHWGVTRFQWVQMLFFALLTRKQSITWSNDSFCHWGVTGLQWVKMAPWSLVKSTYLSIYQDAKDNFREIFLDAKISECSEDHYTVLVCGVVLMMLDSHKWCGHMEFPFVMSATDFRWAWYSFFNLVRSSINFQEGFNCPDCGPHPDKVIMDATTMAHWKSFATWIYFLNQESEAGKKDLVSGRRLVAACISCFSMLIFLTLCYFYHLAFQAK